MAADTPAGPLGSSAGSEVRLLKNSYIHSATFQPSNVGKNAFVQNLSYRYTVVAFFANITWQLIALDFNSEILFIHLANCRQIMPLLGLKKKFYNQSGFLRISRWYESENQLPQACM